MDVSPNDVSSMVRGWLNSPLRGSRKPLPQYQPVSPRPERLGLGADLPTNHTLGKDVIDIIRQRSMNDRRKLLNGETIGVTSSSLLIHEGESSDGDDCSRSAIVSGTKRRCMNSSFTTELTQSRKRKRQRRRDELKKKSMSGSIHVRDEENGRTCVRENGDSAHITSSDFRTSMLVSNSLSDSPADSAAPGCGKFQLFVHVDEVGGSNVGPSRACSTKLKRHMLAGGHNERRKLKQVRKCAEAVREQLVKDCGQRTRKQQSPSENGSCEPSLLPNAMLSNSSLSSSSTVSNDVGKQGTQFDQLCRDLRVNGPCVDLATSSDIATESLLRDKEVAMEHRLHRKRVARCRRGRLTSKTPSSLHLTRRLYLRKM